MKRTIKYDAAMDWSPPSTWRKIVTIDAHTEGEPLRVIIDGFAHVSGDTVLERRRDARENHDALRTALMWEPRGHADMYGCLPMPPVAPDSDFSVLFLHNQGYSSMCGHGILAVTKVVLETGMFEMTEPVTSLRIDTPAGLVTAYARIAAGKVDSVWFDNVPSFAVALDRSVNVDGIGRVRYDLAFGGAYYAYVNAADFGITLTTEHTSELIETGMAIKRAVAADPAIKHPENDDLSFLYGTIFIDEAEEPSAHSRNVCIFADGEVDRSPTGTGVSGRLAIHHARNEVGEHVPIQIESLIGSSFTTSIQEVVDFHGKTAVVPRVEGRVFITGRHEFYIDPEDPFGDGFLVRS